MERRRLLVHATTLLSLPLAGCPNSYEVSLLCRLSVYEVDSKTHGDYIGPKVVYRLTSDSVTRDVADS